MGWERETNDNIDEAFGHFSGLAAASHARLCELIREVDRRQSWMRDGARSLAEWISVRLRVRSETAARLVRVARRLTDLPVITKRFADGDLTLDQVDALSRVATPTTEADLVEEALGLNNAQLDRLARRANPPSPDDGKTVWERRGAYLQWNLDESEMRLSARMPATPGQIVQTALEQAVDTIDVNPSTGMFDPYPQRLLDGLVEICATTGDETSTAGRVQVTVNADLESLTTDTGGATELSTGALVPNDMARWLSCDCQVETIITDGSQVLGVGRNSRTVPAWLRRLVLHRDGNRCSFPGCRSRRWLQVHHIRHWAHGGSTDLDNLITLCGHHHRFIHAEGWHITLGDDGRFTFRRPDRAVYPPTPPDLHPRLKRLTASAGRPT